MKTPAMLSARIRGFRVVNVLGFALLIALAVGGYAFKAVASDQDAKVRALDDQIAQEQKRIHVLKLEVAELGAAPRIKARAQQFLNLQPIDPRHDITTDALPVVVAAARGAAIVQSGDTVAPAAGAGR